MPKIAKIIFNPKIPPSLVRDIKTKTLLLNLYWHARRKRDITSLCIKASLDSRYDPSLIITTLKDQMQGNPSAMIQYLGPDLFNAINTWQ